MALRRRDLEDIAAAGCANPGCTHRHHEVMKEIYLHGRCHPRAGVEAMFKTDECVIEIRCRVCKKLVAGIAVAE